MNGTIFFKLFLSDLDEKITFAGCERHPNYGKHETSLSCLKIYLPCRVSHENRKYSLTLNNFSLSSQQLVPNYYLYPSKILTSILAQFSPNKHSSVEKADCRELLEAYRDVIDVKSIAFLVILLAPEDSFVTLHMRWHNRMLF